MKLSLPLNKTNETAIEEALKIVNGRASTHTYTTYGELKVLEAEAQSRLDKLGITLKDQDGVKLRHQSGEQLPSSYGSSHGFKTPAKTTNVELTRQGKQWVLTGVDESQLWGGNNYPKHSLVLPKALAAHTENAPRALHVAVEGERPQHFSVPEIDQALSLETVLKDKHADAELKQFEKEGFSIAWDCEANIDYFKASFKGQDIGVLHQQEALHPDDLLEKSDASILANFGGLDAFKKEFADEIKLAAQRARIDENIAALDESESESSVSELDLDSVNKALADAAISELDPDVSQPSNPSIIVDRQTGKCNFGSSLNLRESESVLEEWNGFGSEEVPTLEQIHDGAYDNYIQNCGAAGDWIEKFEEIQQAQGEREEENEA